MNKRIYLSLAFALMLVATPAHSSLIYTLDRDGCTGTCGTAPFGQVTLEQTTASLVTVTVTLKPGEVFAGTGAGEALEFNVGIPVTMAGFSAGFGVGPALDKVASFGTFLESVTCTACKGGQNTNPAGPLSFTVTSASGIAIADFVPNAKGYYFAVNLIGTNGNGGNVAAIAPLAAAVGGSSVPEPVSASLFGIGLVAIGLSRRFSRRSR